MNLTSMATSDRYGLPWGFPGWLNDNATDKQVRKTPSWPRSWADFSLL
jgi:hypothetical protein